MKRPNAQVAEALALAAVKGPAQAARELGIPSGTIKSWRNRFGSTPPPVATESATDTVATDGVQPEGRNTRDSQGRFIPGVSGNPAGQTSSVREAKRRAEEKAPDAIDMLWTIASDVDAAKGTRVQALSELLDRGLGKPKQAIDLYGEVTDRHEYDITTRVIAERPDLLDEIFTPDQQPRLASRSG